MKRTGFLMFASALAVLLAASTMPGADALEIGAAAPMTDVAMQDVSSEAYTLTDVAGEYGLLVLFSCNTCPWVAAWEDRYPVVAEQAAALGIGMIAVNSNAAARDRGDGFADMQARAEEQSYAFPYVLDEGAQLASAFGATRTPEAFLFDADLMLVYHGAIDDDARNPEDVEQTYLLDALTALAAGESIDPQVTRSVGCTIKFP